MQKKRNMSMDILTIRLCSLGLEYDLSKRNLKEYNDIVNEARPLSGFFPTHADSFTEMPL